VQSGSTGKPKGVVITHKSTLAGAAAAEFVLALTPKDKYLAYLPLAHIMELMVEFVVLANGSSLNYADPKSLTATGAYPVGALELYSPTHMVAVPKIWDTIKKGLMAKVALSSPVAQVLVNTAMQWRTFAVRHGLDTPLFNALVFKKFKKAVGGELRWALSGGGPLNGEVQEFIRVAFNVPLIQGYGLTETCAGLTIQAEDDDRPGVAGVPIPSCEVKLLSTPDVCDKGGLPYMTTDRHDVNGNPVWGRGEVLVKGGNVTSGYYMMVDKTKEVFSDDGWFASGDIGQFLEDGSIRIVDRKKNLVKLKSGEYVALEKMEMVYGNSDFVDAIAGGICCYADGDMDRPVALFQINEVVAMKWAKTNGIAGDFETVKKSKELYDAVMKSFKAEHAKSDLSHIEKITAVSILTSPWTPENGCLTAANKLQRREVIDQFSSEFETVKKAGIF
jgi:long-chain acyl-CoA synthetase